MLQKLAGSISTRLIGAYLFVATLTSVVGLVGYMQIGQVNDILESTTQRAEARYLSTQIRVEVLLASNIVKDYASAESESAKVSLATRFGDKPNILRQLASQIGKVSSGSDQEQETLNQVVVLLEQFLSLAQQVMTIYDAQEPVAGQAEDVWAQFQTVRADLLQTLYAFGDQETALVYNLRRIAESKVERARRLTVFLSMIALVSGVILGWWISWTITRPVNRLVEAARRFAGGDLDRPAEVHSRSEIGVLAQVFNDMAMQLRDLIGTLEQRVAARTQELERRSRYLEASAQVSRAVASILDADQLIRQVVDLIQDRFDMYYVGLFMLGETGEWAVLKAGTGQAGQIMLSRGHRIKAGQGMVGWSVSNAQPRIALDVGKDAVRLTMAELPDTRSEAALPLRSRGRVIGAFTVQSVEPDAFDEDTIVFLQTMADAVAVALDNARLFTASQDALETTRRAYGESSRDAWRELLHAQTSLGERYDPQGVLADDHVWHTDMILAVEKGRTIIGSSPKSAQETDAKMLAAPIKVRGDQVIGVLDARKPAGAGDWSPEEVALLETLIAQLGVALESAQLYQDTQNRAMLDRLVGEITARMRETLDIDSVLQTAVREIGEKLGIEDVEIRMGSGKEMR